MFWPFKRKNKPAAPIIGEKYRLSTNNPFDRVEVVVLDVQEGWVQYLFTYNGRSSTMRSSIEVITFNIIYKPCK